MNDRSYTSDALYVPMDERGQAFTVSLESVSRDTPPDRGTRRGGGDGWLGGSMSPNWGKFGQTYFTQYEFHNSTFEFHNVFWNEVCVNLNLRETFIISGPPWRSG